jgi:pimeloyl-ACP methyl ester carboxylesterase
MPDMPLVSAWVTNSVGFSGRDMVVRLMRTNGTVMRDAGRWGSETSAHAKLAAGLDRRFALFDGRVVTYREFGAADGFPVIAMHGTPGSRLKYAAGHPDAERLGLRLISVDRWGYGSSDPHPQPALARYGEDVVELAGGLGITQFSVVGISGGGPFAVAVAAVAPERTRSLALVAPVGPIAGVLDGHELRFFHRMCFQWLGPASSAMRSTFGLYRALLRRAPQSAVRLSAAVGPGVDKMLVRAPDVCHHLSETLRAGFERGVAGAVIDMQLFSRPWELALEQISARTRIWLGTEDRSVPQVAVYRLAERIQQPEFTRLQGQGHFWITRHHREVLEWLAERS